MLFMGNRLFSFVLFNIFLFKNVAAKINHSCVPIYADCLHLRELNIDPWDHHRLPVSL